MKGNTEIEMKFAVKSENVGNVRKNIFDLEGVLYLGRKYEKSIMFDNEQQVMRLQDARLRVRLVGDKNDVDKRIEFCFKKRLSTANRIKKEKEIEIDFVADDKKFVKILNQMGYKEISSYERYRETFIKDDVKITLDEFPFGFLLEIEGKEKEIREISTKINLQNRKSYSLSCDDFYEDLCRKKNIAPKRNILFCDRQMPRY